ncbi:deazaflavin-dependent oxidoreductase (nitroreductase family) [Saccharomonospora amisosensis]|uniref:Deazaflavin-dependent oxidoreductase (Nitroreductase family) n=1 Tax=Saccharomonospora amisosensis TaxID=1128677 RepID=A0A7X5USI5_9PSEU|nr:nitroreductase/quinone reductase family protein [Saccharomonospora amisosensis]NIJ13431.1 deazaflavin-dependent oxidoreductase (nitroreductase family) [Saccharomonospora amisosensis]
MSDHDKRRKVRLVQKYLINPPTKLGVFLGLVPGHAIVETVGRRTGRRRRTVVGVREENGTLWIVAEQGRYAGYVRNLEANPDVRVRLRGRWHSGRAEVMDGDDPQARLDTFDDARHVRMVRKFGTHLLTLRITLA